MKNLVYKGLLYKDLQLMKKQGKASILVIIFFLTMNALGGNYLMIPMFINIFPVTVVLSVIGGDQLARFYPYAFSTPITRKDLVTVNYIVLILMLILSTVFSIIFMGFLQDVSLKEILPMTGIPIIGSVITVSFIIPLVYKYGISQAKYVLMIIYFVIFGSSGYILDNYVNPNFIISLPVETIMITLSIVSIIIVFVSYKATVKIVENKEY